MQSRRRDVESRGGWLKTTWKHPHCDIVGRRHTGRPALNRLYATEVFPEIETRGLLAPLQRALEQGTPELLSPALHGYLIACAPPAGAAKFKQMQQRMVVAPLREGPKITGLVVTIEDV